MRLKTPTFWYRSAGPKAWILASAVPIYAAGHWIHQHTVKATHTKAKVICLGNLVAGGSGKTPAAIAVMQIIRDAIPGHNPCFLTRGYGGQEHGPLLVDRDKHRFPVVGDEAILLAAKGKTIISADRRAGAQYATAHGCDLIVMDDGMQNPGLYKDIRLVVIDGASGFGNRMMLPAGPLREPLRAGLRKADAFILVGEDRTNVKKDLPAGIPVFEASIDVSTSWISDPAIKYVAFCGLGHPEKFMRSLETQKLNILHFHKFPDHYAYADADLKALQEQAELSGARLLTTEKDAARLPHEFLNAHLVDVLPVELHWHDRDVFAAFLQDRLNA